MDIAKAAVLQKTTLFFENKDKESLIVRGYDFNRDVERSSQDSNEKEISIDYEGLFASYKNIGYQGTSVGRAIEEINKMIHWRLSNEEITANDTNESLDPTVRDNTKCKIFLGYTSNLISSGLREVIRFLVQHKMVNCIVTTGGGIEEDFIKCMAPTYVGDFALPGKYLRTNGVNRIGNLLVPNDNYCKFEDWIMPILDKMLEEQKSENMIWTPSKIIARLGKEINHPDSVYYWAYKNNIPVYCPAITDGSLGDMIYFHSYKNPGLIVDIAGDIRAVNNEAVFAKKTGVIILGGGIVKHHICNANLMRNGAEYAVFINTGQEFDGSDSGARPDEAVSWGKIKLDAQPVKVYCDATIVFPFIVAQTFVKNFHQFKQEKPEIRK